MVPPILSMFEVYEATYVFYPNDSIWAGVLEPQR